MIAIIAILASILFPVFARARAKARQTACMSNVKQLMTAVLMYADDYDETLVPGALPQGPPACPYADTGSWAPMLRPYVKNSQIQVCPEKKASGAWCSYGWNHQHFGDAYNAPGNGWASSLGGVEEPASTILIGDNEPTATRGYQDEIRLYAHTGLAYYPNLHSGGGNYGFLDGHVKWYSASAVNGKQELFGP